MRLVRYSVFLRIQLPHQHRMTKHTEYESNRFQLRVMVHGGYSITCLNAKLCTECVTRSYPPIIKYEGILVSYAQVIGAAERT